MTFINLFRILPKILFEQIQVLKEYKETEESILILHVHVW